MFVTLRIYQLVEAQRECSRRVCLTLHDNTVNIFLCCDLDLHVNQISYNSSQRSDNQNVARKLHFGGMFILSYEISSAVLETALKIKTVARFMSRNKSFSVIVCYYFPYTDRKQYLVSGAEALTSFWSRLITNSTCEFVSCTLWNVPYVVVLTSGPVFMKISNFHLMNLSLGCDTSHVDQTLSCDCHVSI